MARTVESVLGTFREDDATVRAETEDATVHAVGPAAASAAAAASDTASRVLCRIGMSILLKSLRPDRRADFAHVGIQASFR